MDDLLRDEDCFTLNHIFHFARFKVRTRLGTQIVHNLQETRQASQGRKDYTILITFLISSGFSKGIM